MDKYEYKIKSEEIKQLIAEGDYVQAAEIADTIDWRRVKSVMMLCTISDLYKINRRYEDARDLLLLAYERRPGGRTICYSLCELSIKMEDFLQAVEYYKEFVQVAPKDSGRFVLQYKLYEAQDVSLEERIEVLEELKRHDYREKWAYELAYLYHRVGLGTRCVEECDELILWFGEGKYVVKAMELKALHQPLTAEQQEKYDNRFENQEAEDTYAYEEEQPAVVQEQNLAGENIIGFEQANRQLEDRSKAEEIDIHVKTMDVGQYNTINLQAELAEGLREVLGENSITNAIIAPMLQEDTGVIQVSEAEEETLGASEVRTQEVESEVFFGETGEIADIRQEEDLKTAVAEEDREETDLQQSTAEPEREQATVEAINGLQKKASGSDAEERVLAAQPPKELAGVLSQESDGQISLVMPECENLEKQITGQMSIEDILAEWERMKKENEEKRKEEVRQHVLQQTGSMFTEFEASVRDGLLEQLESGAVTVDENAKTESEEAVNGVADREEPQEGDNGLIDEEAPEDAEDDLFEEDELGQTDMDLLGEEELETEDANLLEGEIEETENVIADEEETEETESVIEDEEETEETESAIEDEEDTEKADSDLADDAELEELEDELLAEAAHIENAIAQNNSEDVKKEGEDFAESVEEPSKQTVRSVNRKEEISREPARLRALTREEKELYAPFIQSKTSREQLIRAVDSITLAAYTGNVIITGEEGTNTLGLAKNIAREIQMIDSNFSGKVAKITGKTLNKKDVKATINQMKNGALIIEKASEINKDTVQKMHKCLQRESLGIILILEDTKKAMNRFLAANEQLKDAFTARIDVEALSNDALVAFGRQYAKEREYSIDELGILALHTRIEDMQTSDHAVTVLEVKEIVDESIRHANRKTLKHFFDVLLAKRYDEEDMIILTEKDFV